MKNKDMVRFGVVSIGVMFAALVGGCASSQANQDAAKKNGEPVYYAVAVLRPTKDQKASGRVKFSEAFGKVKIEADITGLDPSSKHAIHIHEFGDCSAPDGASAGGHYNPQAMQHGSPEAEMHHAGDMGNLVTDKTGHAKFSLEVSGMSISGLVNPILGRGVIVHKNADDFISQPTGGAGARIACGVIGATSK